MNTPLNVVADFATSLDCNTVPSTVLHDAQMKVLNVLGVSMAAAVESDGERLTKVISKQLGAKESSVIGGQTRLPATNAALINGTLAHGLDFDDTHPVAIVHPSSFLAATALAVAEQRNVGGKEALVAFVAGMECTVRIGMAAPGGMHARGFHATGVCGALGSAVVASKLMELNRDQTMNAVAIASSMGSGIFEYLNDGSWVKPLHPGWAAHAGITAAALAEVGLTGPATALEGRYGLLRTHADPPYRFERLTEGLGEKWETLSTLIKPFPCGHIMHPFITAALRLREEYRLDPGEIRSVTCTIDKWAVPIVCEPADSKDKPQTAYHSRFSLPFTIAAALSHGRVDTDTYSGRYLTNNVLLQLASHVGYRKRETWDPDIVKAGVHIEIVDGREFSTETVQKQMTDDEIRDKFRALARRMVSPAQSEQIIGRTAALEDSGSVEKLMECVVDAHTAP